MRILIKPLLVLASFLVILPAMANSPIPDEDFIVWLDAIKTKILAGDKIGLVKEFTDKKVFACTFYVAADGNPEKLTLFRSSEDCSLDASAMDLVRKSSTLPICPYGQHRMVILTIKNKAIELSQAGYH